MGYSLSQNVYICIKPKSQKIYYSRHVLFHEHTHPFRNLNPDTPEHVSPSLGDPKPAVIFLMKLNLAPLLAQASPPMGTESTAMPAMGSSHVLTSLPVSTSPPSPLIS